MTYREGDKVTFTYKGEEVNYRITCNHLANDSGINQRIFNLLGVSPEAFCSDVYGYPSQGGDWPQYNYNDMAAANRVIEKLQKLTKQTPTTFMGKLTSLYKSITRSEPEKTFIKAGVMGEDLELTQDGKDLFIDYLFNLNKDTFRVDVVDAIVLAQEKESK